MTKKTVETAVTGKVIRLEDTNRESERANTAGPGEAHWADMRHVMFSTSA
ncbi:hypothetical protein SAMN05216224_101169 [Thioclava dalianensis]|nr:hypothetical protein [Thioclava dalianensis]SFM75805.1 hypothetical protein SAMN05216224_101169 [Thioclava dalianensis]